MTATPDMVNREGTTGMVTYQNRFTALAKTKTTNEACINLANHLIFSTNRCIYSKPQKSKHIATTLQATFSSI